MMKTLAILALCCSFSLLTGCSTITSTITGILAAENEQATKPAAVASTETAPESVQTVSEL